MKTFDLEVTAKAAVYFRVKASSKEAAIRKLAKAGFYCGEELDWRFDSLSQTPDSIEEVTEVKPND